LESQGKIDVITIIILGSLGMLTLASFIIVFIVFYQKRLLSHKAQLHENENRYQRQLLDASVEVAEQERKKIATNIHDDVGVALNTIKLNFSKIKRNLDNKELTEKVLQSSSGMLEETIATLRAISHDLMPPTLVRLGLKKGISELCYQLDSSGEIKVSFKTDEDIVSLSKKNEMQLYRLIKEVINNILKHSGAKTIEISMHSNNGTLFTSISHNGEGINMQTVKNLADSGKGIGLKSILSRAQLTGSVIQYIILTPQEAKITIETPFETLIETKDQDRQWKT
jgi:two-component system, NarL family, sensor kinase